MLWTSINGNENSILPQVWQNYRVLHTWA